MSRETCYRCFWPQAHCWCDRITPMPTRTRFVFLMHPKEYRREKAGTGRLTHLCLPHSEIVQGVAFDENARVQAMIQDPSLHVVLLYPGREAINLSDPVNANGRVPFPGDRQLVVLVLDATWSGVRKMLKLSPSLQRLPRIMFTPSAPSRFLIKAQPIEGCLSTLESVHEVLTALAARGLDDYSHPTQLLDLFAAMQQFQIDCARDPNRGGYRRRPYKPVAERKTMSAQSRQRRSNFFRVGEHSDG